MAANPVPRLEIVDAEGNRREMPLADVTTIGRQAGNDVVVDDQRVSRQHALIECRDGACALTDLESSNGTYLEGIRLTPNVPMPVPPGAEIKIGASTMKVVVEVSDEAEEMVAREDAMPAPPPLPSPEEGQSRSEPPPLPGEGQGGAEPPSPPGASQGGEEGLPPGLEIRSRRLLSYLPSIYHTEFMSRFLGIFETMLTPIEWNIDNFDLFLDPGTAPADFLTWLAEWFDITFDPSWTEAQQRQLLREAHLIYARRGTRWALSRVLEIYTGHRPEIVDDDDALEPYTFSITLPVQAAQLGRDLIEHLIDAHKPTHTMYTLEFRP